MKENTYDYPKVYPFANCRMQSPFKKGGQGDLLFNLHNIKLLQINPPRDIIIMLLPTYL